MIHPLSAVALATILLLAPWAGTRAIAADRTPLIEAPNVASDSFQKLLAEEKFTELEKFVGALRTQKTRASDGLWALSGIYNDAHIGGKEVVDADFEAELGLMRKWQAAIPDSITRPVVEAQILIKYASKAPSKSHAPSDSENRGNLFKERIARAKQVLDEAALLPSRCPHWYALMQTIATVQSWPRTDYERLFTEAIQHEPSYETYYFKKAHYLLMHLHGERGEAVAFLDEATTLHPAGMEIYARVVWSQIHAFRGDFFKESGYDWEKTKAGFEAMLTAWPHSAKNIQAYAYFACRVKDRDLARSLFEKNQDADPVTAIWRNAGYFEQCKRWALWQKKPSATPRPIAVPSQALSAPSIPDEVERR